MATCLTDLLRVLEFAFLCPVGKRWSGLKNPALHNGLLGDGGVGVLGLVGTYRAVGCLVRVDQLPGAGILQAIAQFADVCDLLPVFGRALDEVVKVDGDGVVFLAVIDHWAVSVQTFEVLVDFPEFSHYRVIRADRGLALDGHADDLGAGVADLRLAEGDDQAQAIEQSEQLGVVLVDPFHTDVAAQLIAAMATVALFIFEWCFARETVAVKGAQLSFVTGHAAGEQLQHL